MSLEQELSTYRDRLPGLREHEGKFVLIKGTEVADVFAAYEVAIKEGYQKFGLEPFLVKRIQSVDQVHFVTRLVAPRPVESQV